ncbi:hypothetical protein NUW54_g4800 [Trametes sanguinea]|uniref:Uncharacterized protein n=1 Tax=Trametes sanguinea TaxID=158606 RepID=A0ACC1PWW1_9APHY|nr:hypothetical protein NUW54_g4800 [Trametes sanguinea]
MQARPVTESAALLRRIANALTFRLHSTSTLLVWLWLKFMLCTEDLDPTLSGQRSGLDLIKILQHALDSAILKSTSNALYKIEQRRSSTPLVIGVTTRNRQPALFPSESGCLVKEVADHAVSCTVEAHLTRKLGRLGVQMPERCCYDIGVELGHTGLSRHFVHPKVMATSTVIEARASFRGASYKEAGGAIRTSLLQSVDLSSFRFVLQPGAALLVPYFVMTSMHTTILAIFVALFALLAQAASVEREWKRDDSVGDLLHAAEGIFTSDVEPVLHAITPEAISLLDEATSAVESVLASNTALRNEATHILSALESKSTALEQDIVHSNGAASPYGILTTPAMWALATALWSGVLGAFAML